MAWDVDHLNCSSVMVFGVHNSVAPLLPMLKQFLVCSEKVHDCLCHIGFFQNDINANNCLQEIFTLAKNISLRELNFICSAVHIGVWKSCTAIVHVAILLIIWLFWRKSKRWGVGLRTYIFWKKSCKFLVSFFPSVNSRQNKALPMEIPQNCVYPLQIARPKLKTLRYSAWFFYHP